MIDWVTIETYCERLVEHFHPEKVVLFGSYAYGKPSDDSDVDLLVILPYEGKSVRKAVEIRHKTRPRFPVDLLVRTPEEVQERLALNDFFMREIIEKGKVLFEAPYE